MLLLLCSLPDSHAQQDPQYTMYMFNPLAVNPAYAGSREDISAIALYRNQWLDFPGAPVTQTAAIHSPLRNQRMGVGLQFIGDAVGPKVSTGVLASYAYRIPFSKGKLSFGLRAGWYSYRFDWNKISTKDPADLAGAYANAIQKKSAGTADFGTYYYSRTFYLGLCWSHLDHSGYLNNFQRTELAAHFTTTIGKAFVINDNLTFRPSLMYKVAEKAPHTTDLNLCFLIDEKIWFGVGTRSNYGVMTLVEFNLTKKLRIGYAYDATLNRLAGATGGSHELFLGYDFDVFKSKTLSPRYF